MSKTKAVMGTIGWVDLTVPNADEVRDFYQAVVGWRTDELDMGGYCDYTMKTEKGDGVAGVCHARGTNAGLPAQWLMYVNVPDLDASLANCTKNGGKLVAGPKGAGDYGRYAVIEDPAGAVLALFEPK